MKSQIPRCSAMARVHKAAAQIILAGCWLMAGPSVIAQTEGGTVNFGNSRSMLLTNGLTHQPVAAGDGIKAALYWAASGSTEFLPLGALVDVGIPLAGRFAGGTRTTPAATPAGAVAQFQVRAWGGGFPSYEAALQAVPPVLAGQSPIIEMQTGNSPSGPPAPPASLAANGLKSFTLMPIAPLAVADIIVDNPAASFTGSWATDTDATDNYGADYRDIPNTSDATASGTATFTPFVVVGGLYDVDAWWPTVSGIPAANNVPLAVVGAGGSNTFYVSQSRNGGMWNRIASIQEFAPGTDGFVRIFNNSGPANRKVLADAVRFVYSANQMRPPVIRSITTASGQANITWLASTGMACRVQYTTNLTDPVWVNLDSDITASTATTNATDTTLGSTKQRFYRLAVP